MDTSQDAVTGAGSQDQGSAISVVTDSAFKVSGEDAPKSAWARYILDLAHGYSKITAIQRSGITGSELAEARRDPQCAQVELASIRAAATGDLTAVTRILAQSAGPNMILDAIEESRDRDGVSARDRLGNRRTVLEAARILAHGAQQQGTTFNVGNAIIQVAALTPDQARILASKLLPPDAG